MPGATPGAHFTPREDPHAHSPRQPLSCSPWLDLRRGVRQPGRGRAGPTGIASRTWNHDRQGAGGGGGRTAMVVSGSPIASAVGRDILRQGGNAVDAAVAVGFALAVVHPEAGNLGGGGFMVVRPSDGTVQALDYRETAPGRATRDMYVDAHGEPTERSLTGHLAAGVPGALAGLVEAHRRFGKLPFAAGDRARDPAGARRASWSTSTGADRSRGDSARLARFPGVARELPARRRAACPGTRCASPTWRARSRRSATTARTASTAGRSPT